MRSGVISGAVTSSGGFDVAESVGWIKWCGSLKKGGLIARTCVSILWSLHMPTALSLAEACKREVRRAELIETLKHLEFFLMFVKERIWSINANLLDLPGDRVDGWHLTRRSVKLAWNLRLIILAPKWLRSYGRGGWYHVNSVDWGPWDNDRLLGLGIWIGEVSTPPPPSINRVKP